MSTFFRKLPRKCKTWISPNRNLGEFQLNHVTITKRNIKEIMNVTIRRIREFDSDHYVSKLNFYLLKLQIKK